MEELKKTSQKRHTITMLERELINITGVLDVLSFDEELVVCECDLGVIVLKGDNLHVNKLDLDNGILEVQGDIVSLEYEDNNPLSKNRQSLLGKIFK